MGYFLSVIIPAYNCADYIQALLNSIVIQNWNKEDIEVIICDDNSTDGFMQKVKPYYDKLNIYYYKTASRSIHCPGNTRLDAWHHATGEWMTFIDHDDEFEPGAFDIFKECVDAGETRMVFCKFRQYNSEQQSYGKVFNSITWMHGKFYNVNWIKSIGIDFKENLQSHEDLYFNTLCLGALTAMGKKWTMPIEDEQHDEISRCVYKWNARRSSLSRSFFNEKHYYIEVYFKDYLYAASEPWFICYNTFKNNSDFYRNQIITILLFGYFYIQGAMWRLGDEIMPENHKYMKDMVERVMALFHCTRTDIVGIAMSSPEIYNKIKLECYNGCGHFVEMISFRDYIYSL